MSISPSLVVPRRPRDPRCRDWHTQWAHPVWLGPGPGPESCCTAAPDQWASETNTAVSSHAAAGGPLRELAKRLPTHNLGANLYPLGVLTALQPGPRFQQIGDGDGGASPIPDKSGTFRSGQVRYMTRPIDLI
jgi:hypothetical protein